MRVREWALRLAMTGSAAILVVALSKVWAENPVPEELATVGDWMPNALSEPPVAATGYQATTATQRYTSLVVQRPIIPRLASVNESGPADRPPLTTWSRDIASGETLDTLLNEAGLDGALRVEVALALGAEFDLRRLRPGHELTVVTALGGELRSVALGVDEGVVIEALFGDRATTRTLNPDLETVTLARESVIESSLFEALQQADIPVRFAVDLAQILGWTVDFRREFKGGETLQVLWREARLRDKRLGQPEIAIAALKLEDALYEVVWPEDGTGRATIYVDGEVLRVFAQPVDGAWVSSVFGQRRHPVFGNVRMHTGVDFAAAKGTPVHATAPGRVAFMGRRSGYGRVIEITHGADTMTRYAHLSAVAEGVTQGQRVNAGEVIGNVGATGTATGPNLHYEVLVDGRPTNPLSDNRLAAATADETKDPTAGVRLKEARVSLATHLSALSSTKANESL